MRSITVNNKNIGLTEEGFVVDSSTWDELVAQKLATLEGLEPLGNEQLAIIRAMRKHYDQHESFPILASICKQAGGKNRDCVSRNFRNPMLAWKIAGLPKPSTVFFTSFDGKRFFPNPFY